ncbi:MULTISPECIES: class III lanthipeptide [unclassified Streptomyces]|nr:class III lanthipeptide [Streptomyces sp. NBC_01268]
MSVLKLQNLQPRTTASKAVSVSLTSSGSDCCKNDPQ